MVTICTASLTFSNSTFCPHTVFMCFVWISEQTAIISLYNINWLVCITETQCVYCAVRTGALDVIHIITWQSTSRSFPNFCLQAVLCCAVLCCAVLCCLTRIPLPVPAFSCSVSNLISSNTNPCFEANNFSKLLASTLTRNKNRTFVAFSWTQ